MTMCESAFQYNDETEILSSVLSSVLKKDPLATAQRLIDTFGSIRNVFEARPEALLSVKGMGKGAVTFLNSVRKAFAAYENAVSSEKPKLSNRKLATAYCRQLLTGERHEQFVVLCLDSQCRLIGVRKICDGSLNEVAAYPRLVMETALNYNAHSVILSHNHPGGTMRPSREDINSTLQLQRLLGGVGVILLDHIIVADLDAYSMVEHGDIDFRTRG